MAAGASTAERRRSCRGSTADRRALHRRTCPLPAANPEVGTALERARWSSRLSRLCSSVSRGRGSGAGRLTAGAGQRTAGGTRRATATRALGRARGAQQVRLVAQMGRDGFRAARGAQPMIELARGAARTLPCLCAIPRLRAGRTGSAALGWREPSCRVVSSYAGAPPWLRKAGPGDSNPTDARSHASVQTLIATT